MKQKRTDRSKEDIEFEINKEECTFQPKTQTPKRGSMNELPLRTTPSYRGRENNDIRLFESTHESRQREETISVNLSTVTPEVKELDKLRLEPETPPKAPKPSSLKV